MHALKGEERLEMADQYYYVIGVIVPLTNLI